MEKALFNWPILFHFHIEAKFWFISRKLLSMKFFLPNVCITNWKATFVFISFCFMSFVLFVLFACFYFSVILESLFYKMLVALAHTRHSVGYVFSSRQDTAIQGGIAQYVKYVNRHYHYPPATPFPSKLKWIKLWTKFSKFKEAVQVFSSALQHSLLWKTNFFSLVV